MLLSKHSQREVRFRRNDRYKGEIWLKNPRTSDFCLSRLPVPLLTLVIYVHVTLHSIQLERLTLSVCPLKGKTNFIKYYSM